MHGYDAQSARPVLRCGLCNKPFDKESTLKRHGYYCRSQSAGSGALRSRSCMECARAKTRCDNRRPECSRCLNKGVTCLYKAKKPRSSTATNHNKDDIQAIKPLNTETLHSLATDQFGLGIYSKESKGKGSLLDNTLDVTATSDLIQLEAEATGLDTDFVDSWAIQMVNDGAQYLPSELSSTGYPITPTISQLNQIQHQVPLFPGDVPIPAIPSINFRSFIPRSILDSTGPRSANLVLHTLKSFPLVMLRDNGLPPFIHPHQLWPEVECGDIESLTNCVNLVHMLGSKIGGSHKLFWKNVRMECERMHIIYPQLRKMELLAAMQALSVYILIRLSEGETDYNNVDNLLVTTVIVIAAQFNSTYTSSHDDTQPALYDYSDLKTGWESWILEESARRLCVIYQVVNMLVYFEPASMCDLHETELLLAPLPAKKQLWEAGNEHVWKAENDRARNTDQTTFGLASNGDLVRIDQGWACDPGSRNSSIRRPDSLDGKAVSAKRTANWEEWFSDMDGFGGLVMLAASLIP